MLCVVNNVSPLTPSLCTPDMFLDFLSLHASTLSAYLLDKAYDSLLSPAEIDLRETVLSFLRHVPPESQTVCGCCLVWCAILRPSLTRLGV